MVQAKGSQSMAAPGSRVNIRGEEWLVREVIPIKGGHYAYKVIGMSELVRNVQAVFLDTLDDIIEVRPEETQLVSDQSPNYRKSKLYLESLIRQTPPSDSKIYLGHRAVLNRNNYQLKPAQMALEGLRPRILIADGVGIGKTLEAGILMSELIKRGKGERILVVALKSMLEQFQQEIWSRFSIPLVRLDSRGVQKVRGKIPANKNPFYYYNKIIISIDTLKNEGRYRTYLESCQWDIVVIDECHHVANPNTQRNQLARLLAGTSESLILTSATPHNGKPQSFANLMNMLKPTAIVDPKDYQKEDIKGLFVRRFKKDVADEVGEYFQERVIKTLNVPATAIEDQTLSNLRKMRFKTLNYKVASGHRQRDILFSTTLIKAFLSSPHACLETVEGRIKKIEKKLEKLPNSATSSQKAQGLQQDLAQMQDFAQQLVQCTCQQENVSKFTALKQVLDDEIKWKGTKSSPRVIIFSERKRTLAVIEKFLQSTYNLKKDATVRFHAGLSDQEQMEIVDNFGKSDSPIRALIATDAASEGVNLHYFCHHVIHFDIPWSLITTEQRNGRIDRYGQEQKPIIYYLITRSNLPEVKADLHILEKIIEKEKFAHQNIGDSASLLKLYDKVKEEELIAGVVSSQLEGEEVEEDDIWDADTSSFEDLLFAASEEAEEMVSQVDVGALPSFYESDFAFVQEAFLELNQATSNNSTTKTAAGEIVPLPSYNQSGKQILTFKAPEDLAVRCRLMPKEAIPDRLEFTLTTDSSLMETKIKDSRKLQKRGQSSSWPQMHYLWDLHPVMQWLQDRVLYQFKKNEAPVIILDTLGPGHAAYLFQGIFSNKQGKPVVSRWFLIHEDGGKALYNQELDDFVRQYQFYRKIPNPGRLSQIQKEIQQDLKNVVEAARDYIRDLWEQKRCDLEELIAADEERFKNWYQDNLKEINTRYTPGKGIAKIMNSKKKRELIRLETIKQQYHDWKQNTLELSDSPFIKVVAVFSGN